MKKNIGVIDRVIRLVVGLFVLSLIFWGPKTLWGLLGLIPLTISFAGWCPPYALLGISTHKNKANESGPTTQPEQATQPTETPSPKQ